jgi:hypothetical protein
MLANQQEFIKLPEDDPDLIKMMIHWLYHRKIAIQEKMIFKW